MAGMEAVLAIFGFLQAQGPLGVAYYGAFLTLWTFCCLPTTPLEVAAGFSFPTAPAVAASVFGKTVGSLAAFAVGRAFFAPLIARRKGAGAAANGAAAGGAAPSRRSMAARFEHFARPLQAALELRPLQTIVMIRASPAPIALKNFGLALSPAKAVTPSAFAAVTLVVNVPYSIAWSLTGSSASSLHDAVNGDGAHVAVAGRLTFLMALFAGLALFARACKEHLDAARKSVPRGAGRGDSRRAARRAAPDAHAD